MADKDKHDEAQIVQLQYRDEKRTKYEEISTPKRLHGYLIFPVLASFCALCLLLCRSSHLRAAFSHSLFRSFHHGLPSHSANNVREHTRKC